MPKTRRTFHAYKQSDASHGDEIPEFIRIDWLVWQIEMTISMCAQSSAAFFSYPQDLLFLLLKTGLLAVLRVLADGKYFSGVHEMCK